MIEVTVLLITEIVRPSGTKRISTPCITSFFAKRQCNDDTPNPTDSTLSGDDPEIDIDESIDGETELGGSSNPFTSPILDRLSDFDVISLPKDPGLRRKLTDFHINDRDIIRREYIRRGPCQPSNYTFPKTKRNFVRKWFEKYKPWLEYSIEKDAAYCFVCYLFKNDSACGGDAFVNGGFRTWSKTSAFDKHVGNHVSAHNNAMKNFDVFNKQKSSIAYCFEKFTNEAKSDYRIRLENSIEALRFICLQGLASRGHDESGKSLNQGNYLELLKIFTKRDKNTPRAPVLKAPGNCTLTSPDIQRAIISVFAKETTKKIIEELDGGFFGILADESADISYKEQMALCLRYVDKRGAVVKRFLGIVHVGNTTSLTLKVAIQQLLLENSLTLSSVRGQGYDGASNMRGSINGLKSLIMNESPCAYYVHFFAHQLQLTLIAVAKKNVDCSVLFESLAILLNVIASSPKRKEILRNKQAEHLEKALQMGEIASGSGLNQEKGINRPGDTHWGSHFKTILSVFALFPTVLDVLEAIGDFCDGTELLKVEKLAHTMRTFDFVFIGQLMITILGITNELNLALQKKNQDIVNAMALVDVTKKNLQKIRDDGWDTHMEKVKSFCDKYDIFVPTMSDTYMAPGRYKRGRKEVDNDEHFRIDVFLCVVDQILHEINSRFDEVSKTLLVCMSCFSPNDQFSSFDVSKLLRLAHYYPSEFSKADLLHFEYQLKNYFEDIRHDERFWNLKNLNELSIKLVETKKHLIHSKVYLLLNLVLVLPVATASVERAFSAMTYIKNKLRNSMRDELLNDYLVTFIEKDIFCNIIDDEIINHYQNMRTRRLRLE